MSVIVDTSGRRAVQLEVEVPGTPEQVWHAIATGPGITAWFTRTEVDEREGGAVQFDLGGGQESRGQVTKWDPPRRFDYEERDWAPNAPPLATEITVEARDGGTCVIRMVHSLFASDDAWDDQLEGMAAGWPGFFEILRLYLREFAGQPSATVTAVGYPGASEEEAWQALTRTLGVSNAVQGQRPGTRRDADLPPFDGVVHRVGLAGHREVLLRLERPTTGAASIFTFTNEARVTTSVTLYLYGADAAAIALRDAPLWRAWMERAAMPAREAQA